MENPKFREFHRIRLKTLKKLFNYDQKANPIVISIDSLKFAEFRETLNFPYKIAVKISKLANYFQTKNNFDENSTWRNLKYQNQKIQAKKFQYFSKIGKLGSFFNFHIKSRKHQNRRTH